MNVIVVGAGLVGFQVANRLLTENNTVTIIEQDDAVIRYTSSRLDCMVVQGAGNNIDNLRRAGAEQADYFIALTGSDEINLICCALVEAEFNIPNKLARVRNEQYLEAQRAEQNLWGVDYLINPSAEAVKQIVQQVDAGAQDYVMLFENLDIQIQRLVVSKNFPFIQKTISDMSRHLPASFIVPIIHRGEDVLIPDGSSVIQENDELYIAAKEHDVPRVFTDLRDTAAAPKKILIVGAGSLGILVLQELFSKLRSGSAALGVNGRHGANAPQEKLGLFKRFARKLRQRSVRRVIVVERDYVKCRRISEQFPDVLVIHADISEENIFEEERLNECDLLITATENTEFNIITSLYARTVGIHSSITLVRSENQSRIAEDLGLKITLSLKNTVVNSILRYVLKVRVRTVHSRGLIDFLECTLDAGSPLNGKRLKDLSLPLESIILYVKRNDETSIPDGDFTLQVGDAVLFLVRSEHVQRIEELVNPSG